MHSKARADRPLEDCTLSQLCNHVISYAYPLEDIFDFIEDRAFAEAEEGEFGKVIHQLERMVTFYEYMENKNEENCRDLVDIYVLMGEVYQYFDRYQESIEWLQKGVVVNDRYFAPYHSLARAYLHLNDYEHAIRSLEQEIALAPGNYYAYILLADLYEATEEFDAVEETLNRLLERDHDNIEALHKLIVHYQNLQPEVDIELLRRRLINIRKSLNEHETIIWTYHMYCENRLEDACRYLDSIEEQKESIQPVICLLKAFLLGKLQQFNKKRDELLKFIALTENKNGTYLQSKLEEFEAVFGILSTESLQKRLSKLQNN